MSGGTRVLTCTGLKSANSEEEVKNWIVETNGGLGRAQRGRSSALFRSLHPSSRIGLCSHTPGAQVVADIDGARLVHGGGAMVVDAVMSLVVSASAMQ